MGIPAYKEETLATESYHGSLKTRGRPLLIAACSVLCVCLLWGVSCAEDTEGNLFADYYGPIELDAKSVNQNLVIRQRLACVRLDVLAQKDASHIILNLFDNVLVTATLHHVEWNPSGGFAWIGYVGGKNSGQVILVVADQEMAGTILFGDVTYHIRPFRENTHVIREIRFPSRSPESALAEVEPYSAEQEVAVLVNQERDIENLSPLKWNDQLFAAARGHSVDMAVQNYFNHISLDGRTFDQRIVNAGYQYSACGENIAAGYSTPQAVMNGWMASSGHRANILSTSYCDLGVGYGYDGGSDYRHYWTQDFGRQKGVSVCAAATFTVTATAGAGGSISPSGSVEVTSGESQTFRITPAAPYEIRDVRVDGVSVGAVPEYTFEYVTSDHTIEALFQRTAPRAMPWLHLLLLDN
jgi:uncharacterized protein YkwD